MPRVTRVHERASGYHSPVTTALAIVLACYLIVLFVVSLWANRQVQNEADYIVAGRRLPFSLSTATLLATWFGAGTLMTATDEIRASGLKAAALEPYGAGLCLVIGGIFVARRLWESEVYTVSDVINVSYGPASEVLSVVLAVPGYIGWLGIQLVALAGILHVTLDIPMTVGIIGVATVSLAYTLLGGMWSVTITDAIQMLFIVLGVLWLGYVVIDALGSGDLVAGVSELGDKLPADTTALIPRESFTELMGWVDVLMISMLGNLPSQELAQRIMASQSAHTAQRACIVSGVLYMVLGTVPVLLGLAAQLLLPEDDKTAILQHLALRYLSPAMVILFALSIFSVVMSTLTSGLLAPATILAQNLVRKLVPESVSSLTLCRYCVLGILLCSVLVALFGENAYSMLEASYGIGLVGLFVPFAAGIYGLRASDRAAFTAMMVGTAIWALQFVWDTDLPLNLLAALSCALVLFATRIAERQRELAA